MAFVSWASYEHKKALLDDADFYQKAHQVIGTVDSLVTQLDKNIRFNFTIKQVDQQTLIQPIKVRLTWYSPTAAIKQGQQWQLSVKLKPAHGLANSGGFNYQVWLREKAIVVTGYVYKAHDVKRHRLLNTDISTRQSLYDRTQKTLDISYEQSSITKAIYLSLTFGVRDYLNSTNWQVFNATGTQHLIAISGLHIGLVAGASFYLFLLAFRFFTLLSVFIASQLGKKIRMQTWLMRQNIFHYVIAGSWFITVFYCYLAGFTSPTLRALLMLSIFWFGKLFNLYVSKTRLFLLTLVGSLFIQPMSVLSLGFWLSFYAVALIFIFIWCYQHFLSKMVTWRKYLFSLFGIQVFLSIGILPVAAFFQYNLPFSAFMVNLIAVPLLAFIVLPVTLAHFVFSLLGINVQWLTSVNTDLLLWFYKVLEFFAGIDWLIFEISRKQLVLLVIGSFSLILSVWYITRRQPAVKYYFSALPLLLFITGFELNSRLFATNNLLDKKAAWQTYVLDVGQGLAVVIVKNNHVLLYDTGASYPSGFVMAEAVIAPFLKNKGLSTIDRLVISHSDNDHSGGLAWLKQNYDIHQLVANDKTLGADEICQRGQTITWQGLTIRTLWPKHVGLGKENDDSCVLSISDQYHSVLLTGDISEQAEQQIIAYAAENNVELNANVLIVPHHGSNTSSSDFFIEKVVPNYAVYSAGYLNQWRMPTKAVQQRYQQQDITTYNTAVSGMITFYFSHKNIDIKQYRQDNFPFWFAN